MSEEGGPELSPRQERWLEMFFTVVVCFGAVAGFVVEIFGSWIVALVCGVIAAIVGVVLVRRGEKLF